jgi:hypothetical protein
MKADVKVKGPWKRQGGEDQGRRVEDTGLKVAEEWRATKIIWAPVGNETVLQKLSDKVLCRIEPPVNVPKKESPV